MDANEYTRDELEDLKRAYDLLGGYAERGEDGLPRQQYFAGDDEIVARRALARLLRNQKPLDSLIRRLLAALIDPDKEQPPYASGWGGPIERELRLSGRGRGAGHRQDARAAAIAYTVLDRLSAGSGKIDAAIVETTKEFGKSETAVKDARRANSKKLQRLETAILARVKQRSAK
jgi:hypothetical protein